MLHEMRPKLKNDTFYVPGPDGVYFRNAQGWYKLNGKALHSWIDRLAPYLDGQRTLATITAGLPTEKQAMVQDLIQVLFERGFIKDVQNDLPHQLQPDELAVYASEIAFIDSFRSSAAHRFERFRESRVLLIGAGLSVTALVHALLRCGLRQLSVMPTEECDTNHQRHAEYLKLLHERDPRLRLETLAPPTWQPEPVAAATHGYDVLIHVSDRPMLRRARLLSQVCAAQQIQLIQAALIDGRAWIGPLHQPGQAGCWECAWRRLQANLDDPQMELPRYAFHDQPDVPIDPFVSSPTAALVANQLCFDVFKSLTDAGPLATQRQLVSLDLETLESASYAFAPHPLCESCQQPLAPNAQQAWTTLQQLAAAPPLDQRSFSRRAVACFDPRLGLFRSLSEHDLAVLPLHIAEARVSDPAQQRRAASDHTTGVGVDFETARLHATRRACEAYAASLVDPRRLPHPGAAELARYGWSGLASVGDPPDPDILWTWAHALHSDELRLLPAVLAYPQLRRQSPAPADELGVGSGWSWAEAVSRALIDHVRHLTIAQIAATAEPFAQVDLVQTALDATATRYRELLALQEIDWAIYDVTGALGVPTLAACINGDVISYQAGLDVAALLRDCLEQLVQQVQSVTNGQPRYSLPVPAALPSALQGQSLRVPSDHGPVAWPEQQRWLQQALWRHGWESYAVALDHDPALTNVLPFLVKVVAVRRPA